VLPTIYEAVRKHAKAIDEIFRPILSVITVANNDEAVANDTHYRLAASVFPANTRNALRATRDIKAGTVTITTYGEGSIATPFGDYKQSGFGVGGKTFMGMTTSPKNTKDARHAVWG
tara:strand:- start:155 stop:505 length:351 start_codon:yes stop_codon:yes gene_type:complete